MDGRLSYQWIYRYLPVFQPRPPSLHLVELSRQRPYPESGLAHRLPVGFLGNERPSETSRDTARSSPFGPLSGFAGTEILIGTNASYNASYKVAHLKSMIPDGVMHFLRGTSSGPESAILSTGSKKDTPMVSTSGRHSIRKRS